MIYFYFNIMSNSWMRDSTFKSMHSHPRVSTVFIGVDHENTCHGKVNLENNVLFNAVSLLVLVALKVDDICHCQSNKFTCIGVFVNMKDLEAKKLLRWQTNILHMYMEVERIYQELSMMRNYLIYLLIMHGTLHVVFFSDLFILNRCGYNEGALT